MARIVAPDASLIPSAVTLSRRTLFPSPNNNASARSNTRAPQDQGKKRTAAASAVDQRTRRWEQTRCQACRCCIPRDRGLDAAHHESRVKGMTAVRNGFLPPTDCLSGRPLFVRRWHTLCPTVIHDRVSLLSPRICLSPCVQESGKKKKAQGVAAFTPVQVTVDHQ